MADGEVSSTLASLGITFTGQLPLLGAVSKTLGSLSGNVFGGFLIDPDTALRGLIAANSEIALLVGQRIYPLTTPDNPTFPLIVITRKQTTRDHLMSDQGRFVKILFQIDVFAERVAGGIGGALLSRRIANRVGVTINEFRGSYSNITFHGILNSNESESYDSELEIYRVSQEYLVMTWDPF